MARIQAIPPIIREPKLELNGSTDSSLSESGVKPAKLPELPVYPTPPVPSGGLAAPRALKKSSSSMELNDHATGADVTATGGLAAPASRQRALSAPPPAHPAATSDEIPFRSQLSLQMLLDQNANELEGDELGLGLVRKDRSARKSVNLRELFCRSRRGRGDNTDERISAGSYCCQHVLLFHPNSTFIHSFDLFIAVILLYVLLVVPFRVCFDVSATGVLFFVEIVMDLFFGIDIIVRFRTGYFEGSMVIMDPWLIAKRYCKSWFLMDFISTFPFDLVILLSVSEKNRNYARLPKLVRAVRLARLARLFRIFRFSQMIRRWQAHLEINSSFYRLLKLAALVVLLSHFLACFWYFIAVMGTEAGHVTWIDTLESDSFEIFDLYVASYYWAFTTVTTVGYGDVHGNNTSERLFIVVAMFIGVTMFSYAVGSMSHLVQRIDSDPVQDRIDRVNSYMKYRGLPGPTRVAIRQHYLYAWKRQKVGDEEKAIMGELPHNLRFEVGEFLKVVVLRNNPIFNGAPPEFVADIICRLRPQAAVSGTPIITEGDIGKEMYFILNGRVKVCNRDASIVYTTLGAGDYFGEIALLSEGARRNASVVATSACDLEVLTKENFRDAILKHGDIAESMEAVRQLAEERKNETEAKAAKATMGSSDDDDDGNTPQSTGTATPRDKTDEEFPLAELLKKESQKHDLMPSFSNANLSESHGSSLQAAQFLSSQPLPSLSANRSLRFGLVRRDHVRGGGRLGLDVQTWLVTVPPRTNYTSLLQAVAAAMDIKNASAIVSVHLQLRDDFEHPISESNVGQLRNDDVLIIEVNPVLPPAPPTIDTSPISDRRDYHKPWLTGTRKRHHAKHTSLPSPPNPNVLSAVGELLMIARDDALSSS